MRIGVLTHYAGDDNYGQLLQCYALQQFLKQNGHDPFVIQHKVDDISNTEKLSLLKNIMRYIRALLFPKYRKNISNVEGYKETKRTE